VDVVRLLSSMFALIRTVTTFARNEQVVGSIPTGGLFLWLGVHIGPCDPGLVASYAEWIKGWLTG
jgi:hypothetical protein